MEFQLLAALGEGTGQNAENNSSDKRQNAGTESSDTRENGGSEGSGTREAWGGADVVVVQYNAYLAGDLDLVWPAGSSWTKVCYIRAIYVLYASGCRRRPAQASVCECVYMSVCI